MKTSTISSDYHKKTWRSFKQTAVWKIPSLFNTKTNSHFAVKFVKKSTTYFLSTWWIMLEWIEKLCNKGYSKVFPSRNGKKDL